ncbi:hypothetical protein IVB18_12960 [Bradyrhizobium sp. 186]|nr:hypothetical protein IVB18_12960 [Bradyrhizobium sp. 186]
MIDDQLARAHRNNIQRYRHLLQTSLTEFERLFVERRLDLVPLALRKRSPTVTEVGEGYYSYNR